jgi:hypothetical protein
MDHVRRRSMPSLTRADLEIVEAGIELRRAGKSAAARVPR